MSAPFTGKTALITGGSKGIGAATALLLARSSANVVINSSSDSGAADAVVEEIGSDRSIPAIENMVSKTVKHFGKIDILIPYADILLMRDLEHTTEEDCDDMVRLNVKGPYFLAQKAATAPYLLYNATKGAIEQMTRVMSKDLAAKGICVNCVAPGPTGTDVFYKGKSEQLLKMIAGFSPMGRFGKPEETAEVFVWLSGGGNIWLSGQVVRVDGGVA